ncbi:MAG: hypothetical protein MJB14_08320 [Spirochaetes bacterium]|nr:hypothetical protein [Spirochaetota bacterium]
MKIRYYQKKPGSKVFKTQYVKIMCFFVGRALAAVSKVDQEVKEEIATLPEGFTFMLKILPYGPSLAVTYQQKRLRYEGGNYPEEQADVVIMIKNIEAAFLLFTFQEGTALAFCRDRMAVKGDLTTAMAIVRCLNIVETYLLPKFLAKKALKRYPEWNFFRKHLGRIVIYFRTLTGI